jgi:hypothetical protein
LSKPGPVRRSGRVPLPSAGAGMCPRRGTFFWRNPLRGLSCAAKVRYAHGALVLKHSSPKRRQKRRPHCLRPCASLRATCGARVQRGLAQTRCAQTVASPDPLAAALLGAYRGDGAAEQPTSLRAIAALGPTSRVQAPRAGRSADRVERSDDPCGCSATHPLWLRLRRGGCGVAWAPVRPCFVI